MRAFACAVFIGLTACSTAAQAGGRCSPDDARGGAFYEDVVRLLSETDPELVDARTNFYKVPDVPASAVAPVRDGRTLGRARGALAAYLRSAPSRCIYVLKLGDDHYAVFDPDFQVGHYQGVFIFDREWRRVGGWTG